MVRTIVEIDLPEPGSAQELYRSSDPPMVIVLRDNGDVVLTRYSDRKDAERLSPVERRSKRILWMKKIK